MGSSKTEGGKMKCIRCNQEIEADAPANVVICGSCADDLRSEAEAQLMESQDTGMGYSDRCRFCKEFGSKVEPYLCEHCRDKMLGWFNSKSFPELQRYPLRVIDRL